MEKIVEQTLLYDFYGELLTDHQKQIYEDLVLNDMSLSEIAEERGISRQGVHDMIKRCNKLLTGYEDKLHLMQKFLTAKDMVSKINEHARDIIQSNDAAIIEKKALEIETISKAILEEF